MKYRIVQIHTCTPSAKYRAGIAEGLKKAWEVVGLYDNEDISAEYLQYQIKTTISKLIKQYSGESE